VIATAPTQDRVTPRNVRGVTELKTEYDRLVDQLADLRALLAPQDNGGVGDWRSAVAEANDVAATLGRLTNLGQQAAREWSRGDSAAATYTLNVIAAIIQGELAVRLAVWAQAVPDPDQAALIRAWRDSITEE